MVFPIWHCSLFLFITLIIFAIFFIIKIFTAFNDNLLIRMTWISSFTIFLTQSCWKRAIAVMTQQFLYDVEPSLRRFSLTFDELWVGDKGDGGNWDYVYGLCCMGECKWSCKFTRPKSTMLRLWQIVARLAAASKFTPAINYIIFSDLILFKYDNAISRIDTSTNSSH